MRENDSPAAAYFEHVDAGRYRPTAHTGGAWDAAEQHFSPLGGLIVHAIEAHTGRSDLVLSRISFDILGRLPREECEIRVHTPRPGRTIELVEAEVRIGGRSVVQARAWYLTAGDTGSVAGGGRGPWPPPERLDAYPLSSVWPGGYIASLDVRPLGPIEPGRALVWVSTDLALVDGRDASPLARYVALIDTANGIAVRESPAKWMFPNVDLTVHLHRPPAGGWVGLDTTVAFGPTGQGVTSTVLHDREGEVGHAQQMLTVRPQPQ